MRARLPPKNNVVKSPKVEDVQFKIHRSLLERHSTVFRELFTVPQPKGSNEGVSVESPIFLAGVRALDFTLLLSLMYPP